MNTRVIGLGSPHGDDQAGWEVIHHLKLLQPLSDVELLALDRPGPGLLHYFNNCSELILIDACQAGWKPGNWQQFTMQEILQNSEQSGGSSHQLGIADTAHLAHSLGLIIPPLTLFAIQVKQADLMQPMSEKCLLSCTEVADHLYNHLANLQNRERIPSSV